MPSAHWLAQPGQGPPTAFSRRSEGHCALCTLAQSALQRRPLSLSDLFSPYCIHTSKPGPFIPSDRFYPSLWQTDRRVKRWRKTRHRPRAAGISLGDRRAAALSRTCSPLTSARQNRQSHHDICNLNSCLPFCPGCRSAVLPRARNAGFLARSTSTLRKLDGALWLLGCPGRGTWSDSTRQEKV